MVKNIKKVKNWNGEICGDLVKEYQTNSERKDKQVKDYGEL